MANVFFFKENDTDDRDCVRYLDMSSIKRGYIGVCGACYSGKFGEVSYENVTTILTEEEFYTIWNARDYDASAMDSILEKLRSYENDELFERVKQEEAEWLMDEYNFDEEDVEAIFDESYNGYYDRGLVSCVYDDSYDLGYETAHSCGYIDRSNESIVERYFDFGQFGEDLINEDEGYVELSDGRVAVLNF